MADNENKDELKAGHPPAVKAGGMRIVQHKTPNTERPAKDAEDCTGLTSPPDVQEAANTVSGVAVKGMVDYTPAAVQATHRQPPPAYVNIKPQVQQIQQPRK